MFLEEADLSLDNNHAERSLCVVVLGRKNHYGSRSQLGLEVAALFYTLLGTAKLAGADPAAYITRAVRAGLEVPGAITLP